MIHTGVQLSLPIDRYIPLFPPFIVPYLLGDLLFIGLPVWASIRVKPGEFESYVISILVATAVSYIVYLAFPTFVKRPEVVSTDVFSKAIAMLYQSDRAYNAAPSGHAFYTGLSFLYLSRWYRRYTGAWAASGAIILASTLLIRQHYVLDLVCGLTLAAAAYIVGRYVESKTNLRFAS